MIDVRNLFRVYSEEKGRYYEKPSLHIFEDDTYILVAENETITDLPLEHCLGIKDDHGKLVYTSDIVEIEGIRRLIYPDGTINWGGDMVLLETIDCNTLEVIGNEHQDFDKVNGELL